MRIASKPTALGIFVLLCFAWGGEGTEKLRSDKTRELLDVGGEVELAMLATRARGGATAERLVLLFPRARDAYLDVLTPIYAKHLDDEALEAALTFFRSQGGKKYCAATRAALMEWARAEANPISDESRTLNREAAVSMCKYYYDAAEMYKITRGRYPRSLDDLAEPVVAGAKAPVAQIRRDPWGRGCELRFTSEEKPRVVCLGPDGVESTDDDIAYPDKK
jgi:hypothetical protein